MENYEDLNELRVAKKSSKGKKHSFEASSFRVRPVI
jgi:hypothetical protein